MIDHARLQSPMLDLGRLWLTLDGSCRPRSTIVEHGRPCSTTRRPWATDDHVSFMIGYGRPLTNLFDDDRPWSTTVEHGHLWFGPTIRLIRLLYVWLDQLSS